LLLHFLGKGYAAFTTLRSGSLAKTTRKVINDTQFTH